MKQYLFICKSNSAEVMCREYLCDCFECFQLNFNNCCSSVQLDDIENTNAEEEFDDQTEIENYAQHFFEFVNASLSAILFSVRSMKPLFCRSDRERSNRETVKRLLRPCFQHWEMFFRGNYLKLVRSRHSSIKQFQAIQREVLATFPD